MSTQKSSINFTKEGCKVNVMFAFKEEDTKRISIYVPAFDIWLTASNEEVMRDKIKAHIASYINFYINNMGWRRFILHLHTLGFKSSSHALTMKKLLNDRSTSAKFNNNFKPDSIADYATQSLNLVA